MKIDQVMSLLTFQPMNKAPRRQRHSEPHLQKLRDCIEASRVRSPRRKLFFKPSIQQIC